MSAWPTIAQAFHIAIDEGLMTEEQRDAAKRAWDEIFRENVELLANHRVVCMALGLCDYADGRGYLYAYPDEVHAALAKLDSEHTAAMDLLRRIDKYCREDRARTPRSTRLPRVLDEVRALLDKRA